MNKNMQLVQKSLDTIVPEWETVMVASITDNGFEYDIFNKVDSPYSGGDSLAIRQQPFTAQEASQSP